MENKIGQSKLYGDILKFCVDNQISLKLINTEDYEGENAFWGGHFCDDKKEIVVTITVDDWFLLLLHEFCHAEQYVEKSPFYFDLSISLDIFNPTYIQNLPSYLYEPACKAWLKMELDCNQRVLNKIKKYNLDIDLNSFYKWANCYHQSYYYFYKLKKHYGDRKPFEFKRVMNSMNSERLLDFDELWCENKNLENYFKKYGEKL